jgi:predicted transcriptional regulator
MQVPFDLASRLSRVALLSGRSREDLLREAVTRWIESAAPAADLLGEMRQLQGGFVPQPQSFSVYE